MKDNTFEKNFLNLEDIVKKLENKDITLEDAVNLYKSGLEYSKKCYDILNKSEELIVKTMKESGLEDFKLEE